MNWKSTSWSAPSNIALIKYWGKKPHQLACNPSISFSLEKAQTQTQVRWKESGSGCLESRLSFNFKGRAEASMNQRVLKVLTLWQKEFPWIQDTTFEITSENSFPHSTGIASSASSMAALALCMGRINSEMTGNPMDLTFVSHLSRLASGSACRSVYGGWSLWGHSKNLGHDEYAQRLVVDPVYETFQDSILIVSSAQKKVSSNLGHQLMQTNPYREVRFLEARKKTEQMLELLSVGSPENIWKIGTLLEQEALELHAHMLLSHPSFCLLLPATLSILLKVQAFREKNQIPAFVTLDAGPNVHLIYPLEWSAAVVEFIQTELLSECENHTCLFDRVGDGPRELERA